MQKLIWLGFSWLVLAGCSHHYHPVDLAKKQKLVSELLSNAPECQVYRDKMAAVQDDDVLDDVFHEALRAHCVKKDV